MDVTNSELNGELFKVRTQVIKANKRHAKILFTGVKHMISPAAYESVSTLPSSRGGQLASRLSKKWKAK